MKVPVFLFVLLMSVSSFGDELMRSEGLDYRIGGGGRSRPLGAAVYGELGYGLPLWGNWQEKASPFYGYVRPMAAIISAGTINELDVALQLNPVSFVTLILGRSYTSRMKDTSSTANCANLLCDGALVGDFGASEIAIAYGNVFLVSEFQLKDLRASSDAEDFYEDSSALAGRRGSDRQFSNTVTIGLREIQKELLVGLMGERIEFHRSGQASEQLSLVARHEIEDVAFSYTAGAYRSSQLAPGLALGAIVTWNLRPGLGL